MSPNPHVAVLTEPSCGPGKIWEGRQGWGVEASGGTDIWSQAEAGAAALRGCSGTPPAWGQHVPASLWAFPSPTSSKYFKSQDHPQSLIPKA